MTRFGILLLCYLTLNFTYAQDTIFIKDAQYCPVRDTIMDLSFNPSKRLPKIMVLLNGLISQEDTLISTSNRFTFKESIDKLNHNFETKIFNHISYFALSCYDYHEDISYLIESEDKKNPIFKHLTYVYEIGFQDKYLKIACEAIQKNKERTFIHIGYNTTFDFFKKGNMIYLLLVIIPESRIYLPFVRKVDKFLSKY